MSFCILIRYRFTNERLSTLIETIGLPRLARALLTLIGSCRICYVFKIKAGSPFNILFFQASMLRKKVLLSPIFFKTSLQTCKSNQALHICQLIDQPTRITQLTSSIIDLLLTYQSWNFSDSIADIGISDHCLVYAIRKIFLPKSNQKTVTSKCFQNFIPDSFPTDLSMVPWHLIEQEYKPDNAWDIWQHMFLDIADYHAPLKKKRMRGVASPWITPELKKLIYQMRQTQKHSLDI